MDLKELDILGEAQDAHWYYVSKARALLRAIGDRSPNRILDVGAGSGFFSKILLRETAAAGAVCVDTGYTEPRLEAYRGKPIAFAPSARTDEADLVMMLDVLEHVDDDVALVKEYASAAKPGTRFVVSVPAFSWLWSTHDVFLEHRRRYTVRTIRQVLLNAGLTPVNEFYFFGALFPVAVLQRAWSWRPWASQAPHSMLRRHHPLTNRLLTDVCRAEAAIAPLNKLCGLTAFAVAEKGR
jgi:SAM-dependent methyltransferase